MLARPAISGVPRKRGTAVSRALVGQPGTVEANRPESHCPCGSRCPTQRWDNAGTLVSHVPHPFRGGTVGQHQRVGALGQKRTERVTARLALVSCAWPLDATRFPSATALAARRRASVATGRAGLRSGPRFGCGPVRFGSLDAAVTPFGQGLRPHCTATRRMVGAVLAAARRSVDDDSMSARHAGSGGASPPPWPGPQCAAGQGRRARPQGRLRPAAKGWGGCKSLERFTREPRSLPFADFFPL
jgi:hypothetical protein